MLDVTDLVKLVKRAAVEAVEAMRPVQVCYGQVVSVAPLQIQVEQKMLLEQEDLAVLECVADFKAEVDGKMAVIRNGLAAGDRVALIQEQGGQRYVVAGRVK